MAPKPADAACAEIAELLPAYVVDALNPGDSARVEAHVAVCAECREERDGYRLVAERLPYAVPPVVAPSPLEADLLARLGPEEVQSDELEAVTPSRAVVAATDEVGLETTAGSPGIDGATVLGQPAPRGLGWAVRLGQRLNEPERRWSLAAVTVTLLLVVVLLGSNLYWAVVNSALRSDRQDLIALVDGQQAVLGTVATGGRAVILRGAEAAPGAVGTLTMDAEGAGGVLVVSDLPRQPMGKVYQLWLIHDGRRDSGGLFTVDAQGRALLHIESRMPLDGYQAFGVTLEPEGGSPAPTSPPALRGTA